MTGATLVLVIVLELAQVLLLAHTKGTNFLSWLFLVLAFIV